MSYKDRIQRMRDAGQISDAQASEMLQSIEGMDKVSVPEARRKLPLLKIFLMGLVVLLGALIVYGAVFQPDPHQVQIVSETLNQPKELGVMNKNIVVGISLIMILVPTLLAFMWMYNSLVGKEESVLSAWAQVESNYQRRADLVPNLVKTVQAFTAHETEVLTNVTEVRTGSNTGSAELNQALTDLEKSQKAASQLTQEARENLGDDAYMASLSQAQKQLGGSLSHLMGVVENYPQLRSSDNFMALQAELEGTENRINVARMAFNHSVKEYNASIRVMPGAMIAGMAGFQRKAYFEADENTNKAVKVEL